MSYNTQAFFVCKLPIAPTLSSPANASVDFFNINVVFQWESFPGSNVGSPCGSGSYVSSVVLFLDSAQDLSSSYPQTAVFNTTVSIFESSEFGMQITLFYCIKSQILLQILHTFGESVFLTVESLLALKLFSSQQENKIVLQYLVHKERVTKRLLLVNVIMVGLGLNVALNLRIRVICFQYLTTHALRR